MADLADSARRGGLGPVGHELGAVVAEERIPNSEVSRRRRWLPEQRRILRQAAQFAHHSLQGPQVRVRPRRRQLGVLAISRV